MDEYNKSAKRVFFLDDCGTLRPFCSDHDNAMYDNAGLIKLLTDLCANPMNTVYLMSGRRRQELEDFMTIPNLGIRYLS
jgi:trehalose-6-phosphatase